MKFNDDITLDIAKAVSDVLEGKKGKHIAKKVNKEEMDPTDHVKKSDEGKFCVYNAANKKVAEFDTKDEADKYAIDNHDKLMAAKNEVAEPEPKGEKDFKDKHVKKVSGMKNDGTNIKESKAEIEAEYADELSKINEAQSAAQKAAFKKMLDAKDKAENKDSKKEAKEEETPTGPAKEESEKQKKYQAFFAKALKKFGVKSPAELEGDKKKEFFDYVDANYEADDEPEEGVKEGAEQVDEILGTIKKAVKKGIDKVAGSDLSGDKAKLADMKTKAKELQQKSDDFMDKLDAREKELNNQLKSGKIDKAEYEKLMDRAEDYYSSASTTAGIDAQTMVDKIKELEGKK